jgi:regulator of RNase E activity RraA
MEPSDLVARYEKLSTPVVYDVLDQMGFPDQAVAADVRPLDPGMRVVGPAFTVTGDEYRPGDDGAAGFRMFREVVAGSVLVLAQNGHRASGPWGENASISAMMKGAKGLVTDGRVRDADGIADLAFPVFSRSLTPVFMNGRFTVRGHLVPVELDGQTADRVPVRPGDLVVADRDGVVVVPAELTAEVLAAAEELERIEERLRTGLRAGEDREAVYRRHPKFAHVRKPADRRGNP